MSVGDGRGVSKVAVMQPYLFPYLGYFQLFRAANAFVALDDASFIKKGWINRNRILLQGAPYTFTVPIRKQSQNVRIKDSWVAPDDGWRKKLLMTIHQAYRKAPYHDPVMRMIEATISSEERTIDQVAMDSILQVLEYLGISTEIRMASSMGIDPLLTGQDRILAICSAMAATTYVNPQGGRELYDPSVFKERNMELRFLHMSASPYDQGGVAFQAGLSMVDVMMWNSTKQVNALLNEYTLEP